MMNANSQFGTSRYPLIMYTILFCRSLLEQKYRTGLKVNTIYCVSHQKESDAFSSVP